MEHELSKDNGVTRTLAASQERVEMFNDIERTFQSMIGTVQTIKVDLNRIFAE